MDFKSLQYFLAVAKSQNITQAAQSLHFAQPTLSIKLKQLEEELDTQLLIRGKPGTRKVMLTREGMILAKRAEEVFELLEKAKEEVTGYRLSLTGDISICAVESDSVCHLSRAAQTLRERYPGIRCHIYSSNGEYAMEQLDDGMVDFALIYDSVNPRNYEALLLPGESRWGVLMRRDSPLAQQEVVRPEYLRDKPLLFCNHTLSNQTALEWLNREMEQLNVSATYDTLATAFSMVEAGLGYAFCLDHALPIGSNGVLCFRPLLPRIKAYPGLIWKKDIPLSKPAELFLEVMQPSQPAEGSPASSGGTEPGPAGTES